MEVMLSRLYSLHSVLKISVDTAATVHYDIHKTLAMTICRLNNHGLHYPLEKSTLPTTKNTSEGKYSFAHGDGSNACDRPHAEDYRKVTDSAACEGKEGEAHNAGGYNEKINSETAKSITLITYCPTMEYFEHC